MDGLPYQMLKSTSWVPQVTPCSVYSISAVSTDKPDKVVLVLDTLTDVEVSLLVVRGELIVQSSRDQPEEMFVK